MAAARSALALAFFPFFPMTMVAPYYMPEKNEKK